MLRIIVSFKVDLAAFIGGKMPIDGKIPIGLVEGSVVAGAASQTSDGTNILIELPIK